MVARRKPPETYALNGPAKRLRIHGTIARDLGIGIVTGKFAPGEILHGEIAASHRLQVSRTAYREAVRILAAKGLVESRPKTGTRVSPSKTWHLLDPDVLSWIFQSEPDHRLLANLFELRRIIEPEAAALAAARRSEGHVETMGRALEDMAKYTLTAELGRVANRHFHSALLDASDNAFLVSLATGVQAAVSSTTKFTQRKSRMSRDPIPDHRKVLDAVMSKDAAAAREAMSELIDRALIDTTNTEYIDTEVAARG
jgi:DNA-binding FadR family transcriptional regulator